MPDSASSPVAADRDCCAMRWRRTFRARPDRADLLHLLATPDHSLFSDEIVARIRGMCHHLACRCAGAGELRDVGTGDLRRSPWGGSGRAFRLEPGSLSHCHALALEWQLAETLDAIRHRPRPAPLVRDLTAQTTTHCSAATGTLTAQARFAQTQQRMELPLNGARRSVSRPASGGPTNTAINYARTR